MELHIKNILNDMEKDGYDGYLLANFSNIQYLSNYKPTSFAFAVIKENPVIYTSKMDLEIANRDSTIEIKEFESFSSMIDDLRKSIKKLAIEPSLEYGTYEKFRDDFDISAVDFVNKQRAIKSPKEIFKIEEATEIAQQAFRQIKIIEKHEYGAQENMVAFELDKYMRENGASEPSFETILTSGANSSLPHAVPTPDKITNPVLIDWGAKYNGYCSDNTRTLVYTEKQHEIFDIVAEAHNKTIHKIKPGMECWEVDKIARDIISEYGYGDNFIHSTGHSLGLDIHESPSFSSKDKTIVEKGMVMTVEPGIYLEGEFGVRLEDTVAIDNKARILGKLPLVIE
ncbi:MAG: aminopeptidase P family protein [Methanobrevibacter sp.]|uniref:M24 family metallopeptidase n=1 Tax=Methanobrevibacter sp. TaxID=66852 RepID=UPI0026DF3175|nr:aminopeptidase P family protein [Methanobrevibacter sp.]MDO5848940.1 aminopeptidase P family protein [Methanobrevibacter sp.]